MGKIGRFLDSFQFVLMKYLLVGQDLLFDLDDSFNGRFVGRHGLESLDVLLDSESFLLLLELDQRAVVYCGDELGRGVVQVKEGLCFKASRRAGGLRALFELMGDFEAVISQIFCLVGYEGLFFIQKL